MEGKKEGKRPSNLMLPLTILTLSLFLFFLNVFSLREKSVDIPLSIQKEVKTLVEYEFLLERESLSEMTEERRVKLEFATWDLGSSVYQKGVYSALKTPVQTKVEERGGGVVMKVNYPHLAEEECLALKEVATEFNRPYAISNDTCNKEHNENWVAIYFPDKKA